MRVCACALARLCVCDKYVHQTSEITKFRGSIATSNRALTLRDKSRKSKQFLFQYILFIL
jgi:hypothetical protein